jgi:hypothetical protein
MRTPDALGLLMPPGMATGAELQGYLEAPLPCDPLQCGHWGGHSGRL